LVNFGQDDRRGVMVTPSVPPWGELIEELRESADASMQRAADSAGISKQTWNDIVKGHTRKPRARTIARMARAVGLSPDRLEEKGHRKDAADILREMILNSPSPASLSPVPAATPVTAGSEAVRTLAALLAGYTAGPLDELALAAFLLAFADDRVVQAIGDQGHKPAWMVESEIQELLRVRYDRTARMSGASNGTTG
jgi:transcriptional regulator with XRE-family HTH domain